jgi:hypothetical protein
MYVQSKTTAVEQEQELSRNISLLCCSDTWFVSAGTDQYQLLSIHLPVVALWVIVKIAALKPAREAPSDFAGHQF